MASKSMLESLLKKQLNYIPKPQQFYGFHNTAWRPFHHSDTSPPTTHAETLNSIHLFTWNIDFAAPHPRPRMAAALIHLEQLVARLPAASAVVICLQEMQEAVPFDLSRESAHHANDITQILDASWIRQRFYTTDVNMDAWDSHYIQISLVDRRLDVSRVSRLNFVSEYQRDALLVDVRIASSDQKLLRICNVHLDSSYGSMRPVQWKALAKHLQSREDNVAGSIVAGDCNANQPRDRTEPHDNGFRDAYLELGGEEGNESGATWGFQSESGNRWGRQRLDKVVLWGAVRASSLDRIGVGLRTSGDVTVQVTEIPKLVPFVTDHYGLHCSLAIDEGLCTVADVART